MSLAAVPRFRELASGRFRERHGMDFHEMAVGAVIEHRPGRTVTEADNVWQSLLAGNTSPLHIDAHYAAGTRWGRPLVSSLVTFAIVNAMTVTSLSARALANLGWDEVRLPAPCFVGDTLYAESEILERRVREGDPSQGVVRIRTRGLKADGTEVLNCVRAILFATDAEAGDMGRYA